MIITSKASKHLFMLERTGPWEERIGEASERKHAKYQELVEESRAWRMFYEPIEVGRRGFARCSLCKVLGRLGVIGAAKKRANPPAKLQKKLRGGCGSIGQICWFLL